MAAPLNESDRLKKQFQESRSEKKETHYNKKCCYKSLPDCKIVKWITLKKYEEKADKINILIRICKCNAEYNDQSKFKDHTLFTLSELELDGVEAHKSADCHYDLVDVDEGWFWTDYKLKKFDYCPSDKPSGTR